MCANMLLVYWPKIQIDSDIYTYIYINVYVHICLFLHLYSYVEHECISLDISTYMYTAMRHYLFEM